MKLSPGYKRDRWVIYCWSLSMLDQSDIEIEDQSCAKHTNTDGLNEGTKVITYDKSHRLPIEQEK